MFKQFYYFFKWLRPKQWVKNSIIFLPLIFSWNIFNQEMTISTVYVTILFSFFVWSTYIINDFKDIEKDRNHPTKSKRPLASWKLNKYLALILSIILIIWIPIYVFYEFYFFVSCFFLAYLLNTIVYTFYLKNIVIIDVFSIAIWFVIRWLVWIYVINVVLSYWLLIMLFFWSLFLGFLKRFQEIKLGVHSRKNINEYNEEFLKQIISMLATILLLSYTLYSFQSVQGETMIITLPIVSFAIIRYYYNIFFMNKFEKWVEEIIFGDKFLIWSIWLYLGVVFLILSL